MAPPVGRTRGQDLAQLTDTELKQRYEKAVADGYRSLRATRFARFRPLPFQRPWYESDAKVRALVGGNRIGKSTFGVVTVLSACLGVKPTALGGEIPDRWPKDILVGQRFLAAGETFELSLKETIIPKLEEFVTSDMLACRPKRHNGLPVEWCFVSGATLVLRSYQQEVGAFEGGAWRGAWYDEPPPRPIYNADLRGLIDHEGWALITATPLKEPWPEDELLAKARQPDCECQGGDLSHEDVVRKQPLHAVVDEFTAEIWANCAGGGTLGGSICRGEGNVCEGNGGVLPHMQIEMTLAQYDEAERESRERGVFTEHTRTEFKRDFVEDTHLVDDIKPPSDWPVVEVVDPSMKRGLYVKWYVCTPEDRWVNYHAAHIPDGSFAFYARQIAAHRDRFQRQPDVMLMDPRGGRHTVNHDTKDDWFARFKQVGLKYHPAPAPTGQDNTTGVAILHGWLQPEFDPSVTDRPLPRITFCRRLASIQEGPIWAYRRFVWNPLDSAKRQYNQAGKDWIDLDMYLAMWVERYKMTFQKLGARFADPEPRRASLAESYASSPASPSARSSPWARRRQTSLATSYSSRLPDWTDKIQRSYT